MSEIENKTKGKKRAKSKSAIRSASWKCKDNGDKPFSVIKWGYKNRLKNVSGAIVLLDLGDQWRRKVYYRESGGIPFDRYFYHVNRYVQAEWDIENKGWAIEITNYCCGFTGEPVVIPWTKHQRWIEINDLKAC